MRMRTKAAWSLAVAVCFALFTAVSAGAQTVTTGDISGTIVDAQGGVLPGAFTLISILRRFLSGSGFVE